MNSLNFNRITLLVTNYSFGHILPFGHFLPFSHYFSAKFTSLIPMFQVFPQFLRTNFLIICRFWSNFICSQFSTGSMNFLLLFIDFSHLSSVYFQSLRQFSMIFSVFRANCREFVFLRVNPWPLYSILINLSDLVLFLPLSMIFFVDLCGLPSIFQTKYR